MAKDSERDMKTEDITSAILKQLTISCTDHECNIISLVIDTPSFACFPESPTSVTYRARLKSTSETDSGSLISLIEEWVSGGTSIIVTGVLMTVDPKCSVAISSLSEAECQPPRPTTDPTTNKTNTSSMTSTDSTTATTDNTIAIIGGVVAVILVIAICITFAVVTIIMTLILKNRCGKVSIKE